jgi:Ca2+/Na+ antiporter
MFKYIKEQLSSLDGISIYPIISLIIFFLFFVVLLYYVVKMKKEKVEEIRNLPFEMTTKSDDDFSTNNLKKA